MNGIRLRQARELKRWTQQNLADAVGVTQATIARIEQATLQPSAELVNSIARITGFGEDFFLGSDTFVVPDGSLVLYRKKKSPLPKQDEAYVHQLAQAAATLYEHLRRHFRPVASSLPVLNNADYKESATLTRTALGVPDGVPVDRLIFRLEKCGVVCLALPCGDVEGFEAFSTWVNQVPVMVLNADRPIDRIRLTAAHETDHLVRRRSVHGDLKRIEDEAWSAGAELLMPEAQMRLELRPVTLSRLAELKARWGVSMAALVRRAKELGLITANQYTYLNIKRRKMGWWESEPGSEQLSPERPRAIRKMFEMVYAENVRKLAVDLGFPIWLVQTLVGAHAKQLSAPTEPMHSAKLYAFPAKRLQLLEDPGMQPKSRA